MIAPSLASAVLSNLQSLTYSHQHRVINLSKEFVLKIFLGFSPTLRVNLLLLFISGLCFWAGLAGLLPALPLYISEFGATGQQIGLVMGCFGVGLIAIRPRMARMADEQGRKMVLLIGLVAIAAAPFGYWLVGYVPDVALTMPGFGSESGLESGKAIAINIHVLLLMLMRAGHGISIAAYVTAYSALIVDLAPANSRGELIGYMSLVNPLGMALGPALGGFLVESAGFQAVFLVTGGLGLLGLVFSSRVKETSPKEIADVRPSSAITPAPDNRQPQLFWRLLLTPRIRIPAVILLLVGLAFGSLATFIPLYVKSLGLDLNVGLIYTASAAASFTVRFLVGSASDRHGRGRFITLSLVFYTLAMTVMWMADSNVMLLLGGLLQGAGGGTLIPMIAALMADRSHPNERARIFGLCMVGFDVGIAIAGPIFGQVADMIGYRSIFGLSAIMTSLGLIIFTTASSKDLRHSLQFSLSHGRDVYAVD